VDLSSFDLLSLPNSCSWVIDPMHALFVCVHSGCFDSLFLSLARSDLVNL